MNKIKLLLVYCTLIILILFTSMPAKADLKNLLNIYEKQINLTVNQLEPLYISDDIEQFNKFRLEINKAEKLKMQILQELIKLPPNKRPTNSKFTNYFKNSNSKLLHLKDIENTILKMIQDSKYKNNVNFGSFGSKIALSNFLKQISDSSHENEIDFDELLKSNNNIKPEFRYSSIPELMIYSTTVIEFINKNGDVIGNGTGFMIFYGIKDSIGKIFLVTNKHVIQDAINNNAYLIIKFLNSQNDKENKYKVENIDITRTLTNKSWLFHPNKEIDVAVLDLTPIEEHCKKNNINLRLTKINLCDPPVKDKNNNDIYSFLPTDSKIEDLDVINDIIFVGYPSGIYDSDLLLPISRKGVTATPVQYDFEGDPKFLIDASVFPGSSGSPVFACNFGSYKQKKTNALVPGDRSILIGILSEGYKFSNNNVKSGVKIPTINLFSAYNTEEMLDLGVVYKTKCIVEIIEKYIKDHQKELDTYINESNQNLGKSQ